MGRRHTDNASRERMNETDEITDWCAKRLEECEECECMLNHGEEEQGFQVNGGLDADWGWSWRMKEEEKWFERFSDECGSWKK